MANLVTEHMDICTAAEIPKVKGGRGRGKNSNGQCPHGIKKLRELILELAVRGKLVPQNPNEESANVLLEKIAKEKARLIKKGKIKKQKPLSEITEDEKPFELPLRWEWVRLGATGLGSTGKTPGTRNPKYYDGAIPFLGPGQITIEGDITEPNKTLTEEGCEYSAIAKSGDILMVCIGGSIGKSAIAPSKVAFNQQINSIRPLFVDSTYLNVAMNTPHFQTSILDTATGSATPIINRSKWGELLVALPPVAEQNRIVAKVDELMALCDQLEQQQIESNTTHQTLIETLLTTLTNAADQGEFAEAWKRIDSHFDTLFTTEQSVDQLKKTILQLAVMGKLVPQNPNDEPASVLLKKSAKKKVQFIKEGKIKKQKPLPEIGEDEKPFDLPGGWEWSRLQEAIDVRDGTHDSPKDAIGQDTYPLVTSKNFHNGTIKFDEARRISAEDHFNISKRSLVERYDILFSMIGGNLGNQVIVDDDRPFSVKNVALFKYYDKQLTSSFFIKKFMEHLALDLQLKAAGGAQPFVSLGFLRKLVIALPPIEEQHRIVSKVDELMAICDALKDRLNDAQTTQIQLADVIVEQAVA